MEHEHVFELVNDSIMTRTVEGRINFWNRRCEELYGWRKEEANGKVSHSLLQTQFPKPLKEIESELYRNGRWEGRLVHTTRDGARVVVESRWRLGISGQPGAVIEINTHSADYEMDPKVHTDSYNGEIGTQKATFKKGVKRVVKGALRRVRGYIRQLEEEAEETKTHNYDDDDLAYPWLNSIFAKLLSQEDGVRRPNYAWGVLHGVHLAKALGIDRVSVIEFGVAGGNGLVYLDRVAERVEGIFGVGIDVYGFDAGTGLPEPEDYRDLPNLYTESSFQMDVEELKKRLKKTQLILGLVEHTVPRFIASGVAPVAFVSIDLDYYSSTMQAFKLFEADQALLLPRIHCYFDDIMGFTFSEFSGERLAIADFNASHTMRKISPIYGLKYLLPTQESQAEWAEQIYMVHIFNHDLYGCKDGLVRPKHLRSTELTDKRPFKI
jgi:PAS domain S-box-containing protein